METHLSYLFKIAQLPSRIFFATPLLLTIFLPLAAFSLDSCYYPDGRAALRDVPCNPDWAVSACCGAGWDCLLNGTLCIQSKDDPGTMDSLARGSCTDMNWKSDICSKWCIGMLAYFMWFDCLFLAFIPAEYLIWITHTSYPVTRNSSNAEGESMLGSDTRCTRRPTVAGQMDYLHLSV